MAKELDGVLDLSDTCALYLIGRGGAAQSTSPRSVSRRVWLTCPWRRLSLCAAGALQWRRWLAGALLLVPIGVDIVHRPQSAAFSALPVSRASRTWWCSSKHLSPVGFLAVSGWRAPSAAFHRSGGALQRRRWLGPCCSYPSALMLSTGRLCQPAQLGLCPEAQGITLKNGVFLPDGRHIL
jgi:hypothetical protein